jgi:hypothetical protein
LRELSEKDGEDHHHGKRLDHSPGGTYDRLFIPYLNIAPGQEIEEFPVFPKFV